MGSRACYESVYTGVDVLWGQARGRSGSRGGVVRNASQDAKEVEQHAPSDTNGVSIDNCNSDDSTRDSNSNDGSNTSDSNSSNNSDSGSSRSVDISRHE